MFVQKSQSWLLGLGLAALIFCAWFYFQQNVPGELSLSSQTAQATLVVSSDPGPNLPPVGRSLFDFLTMQDKGGSALEQFIPYPITQLQGLIRTQIQTTKSTGLHGVFFPLGRSLQRMASSPDFFQFPRLVMGIDAEPIIQEDAITMFLRDRLYLGFNEKAQALEVISYNELAGRYEFQVVHNYGPGKKPTVQYANRSVCIACHQNQAPIFSDNAWSETNAHPAISSQILAAMKKTPGFDGHTYAGFPIDLSGTGTSSQGIANTAEPAAIDSTKLAANMIPVTQFLWQKLCDEVDSSPEGAAKCRYQVLDLTLKMSLSGASSDSHPVFTQNENQALLQTLLQAWKRRWPQGLAIPNPTIIDRDPLLPPPKGDRFNPSVLPDSVKNSLASILQTTNVISGSQEPLSPRKPLLTWSAAASDDSSIGDLGDWISALSGFFSRQDWNRLDLWIQSKSTDADSVTVTANCQLIPSADHMEISQCDGALGLLASVGSDPTGKNLKGTVSFLGVDWGQASGGASSCQLPSSAQMEQALFTSSCVALQDFDTSGQMTQQTDAAGNLVYVFTLNPSGFSAVRSARLSDGNRLTQLVFRLQKGSSQVVAQAHIIKDYKYLQQALQAGLRDAGSGIFSRRPFLRTKVLQTLRLGLTGNVSTNADCCENTARMPAAVAEPDTELDSNSIEQLNTVFGKSAPFVVNCAICHRNSLGFPPNFLYGTPDEVSSQLSACAEKINYRLNVWQYDPTKHALMMPPVSRLQRLGLNEDSWKNSAALKQLEAAAAELLKPKGLSVQDILAPNYHFVSECKGR